MKNTEINRRSKYFWIIGGGLMQVPLLSEAKKLGLKCIMTDKNPNCVCAKDADLFFPIDTIDVMGHVIQGLNLLADGIKINGVLAAGMDAPLTMAVLARVLALPGVEPEIAYIVHNKALLRRRMKELGYSTPKFTTLTSANEFDIENAIKKVGFPLIVKNTDSSGSRGTTIIKKNNKDALINAVRSAISVSRSRTALIEELWEGPEQTVEVIIGPDGKPNRCFITDRFFDLSKGFALETGLRNPSALSTKQQDELYKLTENFAKDLGVKIGSAKADTMYTKDGPRLIEFTVRLSGGFDSQYLVPAATGKNVLKASILTALGKKFNAKELLTNRKNKVGLTGSIWPKPGRIKTISGLEEARNLPGVERIIFRYKIGDKIEEYKDCTKRVCFVIVTGKNEQEAKNKLGKALNTIKVEVE